MTDKEAILGWIRQNKPITTRLPETYSARAQKTPKVLLEEFKTGLQRAGAGVVELNGKDEVKDYIGKNFQGAIDFESTENWAKYGAGTPKKELEKIGIAILRGKFGIAENGGIWLDEACFPNRLIPFIAEQIGITMRKKDLVAEMQEAYQMIDLNEAGFGVFLSGPSKTADIEQSLVYGAHGAKEMIVLMY